MALPSFILAPGSNELEKWSCARNNEAPRRRKGDSVVLPALCPGEGKEGRSGENTMPPPHWDTSPNVPEDEEGKRPIFETV